MAIATICFIYLLMESSFSIGKFSMGDTVSFSWNGYKMMSFILRTPWYYHGLRREFPILHNVHYMVEMNFKRHLVKYYFENSFKIFDNGICNESEDNLST